MNENRPEGTETDDGNLIGVAERQLESALRELDRVLKDIDARVTGAEAKARAAAGDVRKAIQTLFDERKRIGQLDGTDGTGAGAGELDLDRARAEIGRRLSLLRQQHPECRVFREPG